MVDATIPGLRDEDDLELHPVGIVEEAGVVPRHVRPLLRLVLDLQPLRRRPGEPLVDGLPRGRLECEMVQPDRVAVVRSRRGGLRLAERERGADALAVEVPDGLASLADDLVQLGVAGARAARGRAAGSARSRRRRFRDGAARVGSQERALQLQRPLLHVRPARIAAYTATNAGIASGSAGIHSWQRVCRARRATRAGTVA